MGEDLKPNNGRPKEEPRKGEAERPKLVNEATDAFRKITAAAATEEGQEQIKAGAFDKDLTIILTTFAGSAFDRAAQQLVRRGARYPNTFGVWSKTTPTIGKSIAATVAGANLGSIPVVAPMAGALLEYASARAGMPLGDVGSQIAAVVGQGAGSALIIAGGVLGRSARSAEDESQGVTVLQRILEDRDGPALRKIREAAAGGDMNELIQECGMAIAERVPTFSSASTTADKGRVMRVVGRRSALIGIVAASAMFTGVLMHAGGKAGLQSGVRTGIEHGIKGKKGEPLDTFFTEFKQKFNLPGSEEEIRETFYKSFRGELENPFGLKKK